MQGKAQVSRTETHQKGAAEHDTVLCGALLFHISKKSIAVGLLHNIHQTVQQNLLELKDRLRIAGEGDRAGVHSLDARARAALTPL